MSANSAVSSVTAAASPTGRGALQRPLGAVRRTLRACVARVEGLARARPLLFAVVLVSLLFTAVISIMTPAFQTNDDAIMCMIASGQGIALSPDEHLVFTNALIGTILKTLYTAAPAFPWYGWYLVATQWITTIALLYCLLRPRYTRRSMLGFGAYFLTAGIYFLVNLQFTSTGTLAGLTGGLLLVQMLRHDRQSRLEQTILAISAVLLLVWGSLIRHDIFALTLALICPVVLVTYWVSSTTRRTLAGVSLSLAAATALMFFAVRFHDACYSDPAWQAFYEYNPLRLKFNDEQWVSYSPETKHVFDQVGWSKHDFEMIKNWYYDDPQYDKQTLQTILTSYPWAFERKLSKTIRVGLKEMFGQSAFVAILFVMPGMLLFINRRQRNFWPCAVAFVSAAGILLAITVFRKAPPERVYMPVHTFPWLVVMFAVTPGWRGVPTLRRAIAQNLQSIRTAWKIKNWSWLKPNAFRHAVLRTVSLLVVIGLVVSVRKQFRTGSEHRLQISQYAAQLDEMRPAADQGERLILAYGADFPYEHQAVLFGSNDYSGLRFFCVGWPQRTPIAERMKKHFQIETLGQALATRPEFLYAINPNYFLRVIDYLGEHYTTDLRFVNLKNNTQYALSRIEPKAKAAEVEPLSAGSAVSAFPVLERLGIQR